MEHNKPKNTQESEKTGADAATLLAFAGVASAPPPPPPPTTSTSKPNPTEAITIITDDPSDKADDTAVSATSKHSVHARSETTTQTNSCKSQEPAATISHALSSLAANQTTDTITVRKETAPVDQCASNSEEKDVVMKDTVPAKLEENASQNDSVRHSPGKQQQQQQGEDGVVEVIDNPPESLKKRTRTLEESLERRKRRRRLRRMLKEAGKFPSFVSLISASPDDHDGDIKEEEGEEDNNSKRQTPDIIYIDVDDYLGLSPSPEPNVPTPAPAPIPEAPLSRLRPNRGTNYASKQGGDDDYDDDDEGAKVTTVSTGAAAAQYAANPADEGFYEGRVPMASPDDEQYLSQLQMMIRDNLEYFSASANEATGSQAGRRHPIVRGKVGIRCIHCAKVALEHEAAMAAKTAQVEPDKTASAEADTIGEEEPSEASTPMDPSRIWPSGSVSYPLNIAGLHSVCSQKVQTHFDDCPNMPTNIKAQFYRHVHEAGESRIKSREVPAPVYYAVAAKRIGLVNVSGGMRFSRDLKLQPLPLEAVLAQERQESEERKANMLLPSAHATGASAITSAPIDISSRMPADAESELVLAEALAEPDDPERSPARAADKVYVSDYIFLIIRQLAICRCVPADFDSRGKKTKSMRLGFAGVCCKHCLRVVEERDGPELARADGASEFSCRSFSSAHDNLASSVSNTFALHLAKCKNTPKQIRAALQTFKRSHARHMADLPYGSQGNCFKAMWQRLRDCDVPENEMMSRIKKYRSSNRTMESPVTSIRPYSFSKAPKLQPVGRDGPSFPVSSDANTVQVLKEAIEICDPNDENNLVFPSDREFATDYLFLTIRNLKISLPTEADLLKRRPILGQSIMAGMCCKHCENEDPSLVAPSSRSFPSAPDNYSSALSSSFYNHMQSCQFLPIDVKKALHNLKQLHSKQIAQMKVGSQRRFFALLYDRLRKVPVPNLKELKSKHSTRAPPAASRSSSRSSSHPASSSRGRSTRRSEGGNDTVLAQFGFFEAPIHSFFCARCRMVPLGFRARGSLSFAFPSLDFMTEHWEACKEDGFDLWFVVESLKKVLKTKGFDLDCMSDPLFKAVIEESLGGNVDLTTIFTTELVKVYQMSKHGGVTRAVENYIKAKSQGLWCKFPETIDISKVNQAFEKFAETKNGMSPQLLDHPAIVTFLLLISPSMSMPGLNTEEENTKANDCTEGETEGDEEAEVNEDNDDDNGEENIKASIKPRPTKRGKELRRTQTAVQPGEESEADGGVVGQSTAQEALDSNKPRKALDAIDSMSVDLAEDDHAEDDNMVNEETGEVLVHDTFAMAGEGKSGDGIGYPGPDP